jgi:hypothetical protein
MRADSLVSQIDVRRNQRQQRVIVGKNIDFTGARGCQAIYENGGTHDLCAIGRPNRGKPDKENSKNRQADQYQSDKDGLDPLHSISLNIFEFVGDGKGRLLRRIGQAIVSYSFIMIFV